MADFFFTIHSDIILSSYSSSNIGTYTKNQGSRFILLADPIVKQMGLLSKMTDSLNANNVNFFIYDSIEYNADTKTLEQVLNLSHNAHIDGVIAVGGSKVLNLGRAISSLYNEVQYMYNFIDGAKPKEKPLPLIIVPTTMRDNFSFAECTPIVDSRSNKLKIMLNQGPLCSVAIFDPTLTRTLTQNQIFAMSLESLCLAAETYLSSKANFFTEMISCKAIELIGMSLETEDNKKVTTSKEELLGQGGAIASLASGISSIGAATLLSLCINTKYEISSYLTSSILFPYAMEDAAQFKKTKIAKIARILGLDNGLKSEDELVSELITYLRNKLGAAGLPTRLKDLGLSLPQLSAAAEDAAELDLVSKLPRSMTAEDLFGLIKKAY